MATFTFKNFDPQADLGNATPVKTSAQRAMVAAILEQYPALSAETLELVMPKKQQCTLMKSKDGVVFVVSPVIRQPVFYQYKEGPYFPTLRFLHMAGNFMPVLGIDKGGIKFVLKGANVFCAGITSPGGSIPADLDADVPVLITAEGKELPLAVGITKMSTKEMRATKSGVGVDTIHFLGDDLWRAQQQVW